MQGRSPVPRLLYALLRARLIHLPRQFNSSYTGSKGLFGCLNNAYSLAENPKAKPIRYGRHQKNERSIRYDRGDKQDKMQRHDHHRSKDSKLQLQQRKQNNIAATGLEAQLFQLVITLTFSIQRLKTEEDQTNVNQAIESLKQKLRNAQLDNDPSAIASLINSLCNKIKSAGLGHYSLEKYQRLESVCQQLWQCSSAATKELTKISANLQAKAQQWLQKQQTNRKIKQQQNVCLGQRKEIPQNDQQLLQGSPTLDSKQNLQNLKVSIPQLCMVASNLSLLPKESYPIICDLLLANMEQLSQFALCAFMMDCISLKRQLGQEFLRAFHDHPSLMSLSNGYRFAYISFVHHYIQSYLPLYSTFGKGAHINFTDFSMDFEQLHNLTKLLAIEYEVASKATTRYFLNLYNRRVTFLDNFLYDRKLPFIRIVTLYNVLAKFYPMGLLFIRDASTWRDLKVDRTNIAEVKEFLINVMRNFEPQYIYSIDERPTNQMCTIVMTMAISLCRSVIKLEPEFIAETSPLIEHLVDYSVQHASFLNASTKIVTDMATRLDIENSGILGVLSAEADPRRKQSILKLINFLFCNQIYIEFKNDDLKKQITGLYDQVMKLDPDTFKNATIGQWKFLFQVCSLLKTCQQIQKKDNQKIWNIYLRFCVPYIKDNQIDAQRDRLVRKAKLYEEYIVRIASLARQFFQNNKDKEKQMVNFINNNFIYTAKSVLKYGVFDTLNLLDSLPGVNPEIYAYLFSNLSTFILFSRSGKKYFLKRGKNFCNDQLFFKTLASVANNCVLLKNIVNKDRLNMIKTLAYIFWKKLSCRQIAQLLIVIGNPTLLSDKLKEKVQKNVLFTEKDLAGLDLVALSKFKLQNKSLMNVLSKMAPHLVQKLQTQDMTFNNSKSKQELDTMLNNHQLYEEVLETEDFTNESLISPPETDNEKIKMIYVCLKIADKIRKKMDFSITSVIAQLEKAREQAGKSKQDKKSKKTKIDFSEEITYIRVNNLVKLNDINQFKLDNIEVKGHNEMVEGWNSYEQSQNLIEVEDYNNFGDADGNPYERVLLALNGNYGLIKSLVKKQKFNPQVLLAGTNLGLECITKGSLIEMQAGKQENEVYFFCSRPTTYKLHLIYAYIMSLIGHRVCIVKEDTTNKEVWALLTKLYGFEEAEPEERASEEMVGLKKQGQFLQ